MDKLNDIFCQIKEIPSASILHKTGSAELARYIKENNQDFLGPYHELDFNGKEAEVIIYITPFELHIQSLARARRLLIIVTYGFAHQTEPMNKIMNEAVKKNLMMKISDNEN